MSWILVLLPAHLRLDDAEVAKYKNTFYTPDLKVTTFHLIVAEHVHPFIAQRMLHVIKLTSSQTSFRNMTVG